VNPRRFAETIKGSELIGGSRNEVVFMPQYDLHTKVVIGLQMAGGGLVSKKWQRNNAGIPDSDAMDEEMLDEAITTAVVGAMLGSLQQDPSPQNAAQVEEQAVGYIAGATPGLPAPVPHPLIGPAGATPISGPAGSPPPPGPTSGGGTPPPQAPPPQGGNPAPAQAPQTTVSLQDAQAAIQQLQGLQGKVWLIGEIVQKGETAGPVEIAVTVKDDGKTIQSQVPFPVEIRVVASEPQERNVEVTPGANAQPGGAAKPNPQSLVGIFQQ
jgi:hypothetical protein